MTYEYRVGDIVRHNDTWGVVRRVFEWDNDVDWWVGQYGPHLRGEWFATRYYTDIGAPFAHDYAGIPDKVIARAMRIILTETDQ